MNKINSILQLNFQFFVRTLVLILFFSTIVLSQNNWKWTNPQPPGNKLYDVKILDDSNVIALGCAGLIIKSTNRGKTWFYINSELNNDIYDFEFYNDSSAVAVGKGGSMFKTLDWGKSWRKIFSSSHVDLHLSLIHI